MQNHPWQLEAFPGFSARGKIRKEEEKHYATQMQTAGITAHCAARILVGSGHQRWTR